MKELLFGFLTKTLNLSAEQLAELLYKKSDDGTLTEETSDNALQSITDAMSKHIAGLKGGAGSGKENFDNGYKKGVKEAKENFERSIKSEFGIDGDLQDMALIREVAAKVSKSTLDDDAVKRHPLYIKKENEVQEKTAAIEADFTEKIKKIEAETGRKERFGGAQSIAFEVFDGLRPVVSSDPVKAARVRKEFVEKYGQYDFDFAANAKDPILIGPDNKRVEDEFGHPMTLSKMVKRDVSDRFDLQVQDAKGASGNDNAGGKPASSAASPQNFKDLADFTEKYNAEPDPAKRAELGVAWEAMEAAGTV